MRDPSGIGTVEDHRPAFALGLVSITVDSVVVLSLGIGQALDFVPDQLGGQLMGFQSIHVPGLVV